MGMYRHVSKFLIFILILLFAVLNIASGAEQHTAESQHVGQSEEKYQDVAGRVVVLREEQDFLVFQKVFSQADSKYLILDLAAMKGTLMYRNRVLRAFSLSRTGTAERRPKKGIAVLTGKIDGAVQRRSLLFGDDLIITGRGRSGEIRKGPGYHIGSKDFAALFYALDRGSKAYVQY